MLITEEDRNVKINTNTHNLRMEEKENQLNISKCETKYL